MKKSLVLLTILFLVTILGSYPPAFADGGWNNQFYVNGDGEILVDASGATIPVLSSSSSPAVTSVSDSATSQILIAANTARKGLLIFNNSSQILYVKFGTTASATDFTVRLTPYATYEMTGTIYTGRIDGIWAADSTGAALITELT